jgi:Tfp pilus assembly protein PilX
MRPEVEMKRIDFSPGQFAGLRQRGVGTVAVTLLLLFATSVAVLYANRGVLLEQRASGSQAQATLAHEVAEAGLEWATGMLNSPYDLNADCSFLTTAKSSFRKRYVLTNYPTASTAAPATNVFPGCKIDPATGSTTCNCPTVPASSSTQAVASLGTSVLPSFTVAFESVAGDAESVKITVYACSAQANACTQTASAGNFGSADGSARLTEILKLAPTLRAVPAAPLTCGTSCDLSGGSQSIVNQTVSSNGILVNAGDTISLPNGSNKTNSVLSTLPGLPVDNALIGSDASLGNLWNSDQDCSKSQVFNAFFGSTIAQYASDTSSVYPIDCSGASDCTSRLQTAISNGWTSFYAPNGIQLSGNYTYGSDSSPITLVVNGSLKINGNNTFYGLVFANDANLNSTDIGTGNSTINGAMVTCAGYKSTGNGTLAYDPAALGNAQNLNGPMVRVPGSWRDFKTTADALP